MFLDNRKVNYTEVEEDIITWSLIYQKVIGEEIRIIKVLYTAQ